MFQVCSKEKAGTFFFMIIGVPLLPVPVPVDEDPVPLVVVYTIHKPLPLSTFPAGQTATQLYSSLRIGQVEKHFFAG